jgi:methanogenic corrinoid protein MtbC1/DNA-binding XRE family transcriptional regulator
MLESWNGGGRMKGDSGVERLRRRFVDALVLGERKLASAVVLDGQKQGISAARMYLDVFAPSLVRIGELWHDGNINIAQEHLATSITLDMMDALSDEMGPRKTLGFRAVVTSVEGDFHVVGARMVADFLGMDGWDVDFLGNPTPVNDLIEFVRQRPADVVALSSTLREFWPNAKKAAEALHVLDPGPKVILGGSAIDATDLDVHSLGCDAIGRNALEALSEARRLVGLTEQKLPLKHHLTAMGRRIKSIRTTHRMTQQELANASDLDRTYISMVEHGKQNLTIGAVLRIADALDVPIGELIASQAG